MTIYLLAGAAVLVTVAAAGAILYLATRDVTDGIEDDDVDVTDPVEYVYVNPTPPFPINYIGQHGEHDQYPIRPHLRQLWISHLERSWKLPERTR